MRSGERERGCWLRGGRPRRVRLRQRCFVAVAKPPRVHTYLPYPDSHSHDRQHRITPGVSAKRDHAARASRERARHSAVRPSTTADGGDRLLQRAAQRSPCGAASHDVSKRVKSHQKSTSPTTRLHAAVEAHRAATACLQPTAALVTRTQPPISAWHGIERQRNRATELRRATRCHLRGACQSALRKRTQDAARALRHRVPACVPLRLEIRRRGERGHVRADRHRCDGQVILCA